MPCPNSAQYQTAVGPYAVSTTDLAHSTTSRLCPTPCPVLTSCVWPYDDSVEPSFVVAALNTHILYCPTGKALHLPTVRNQYLPTAYDAICQRICYAISDADTAISGTEPGCAVICRRACYAMSGTDLAHGATTSCGRFPSCCRGTCLLSPYARAMPSPVLTYAYGAISLRACYIMPGTDLAYGAISYALATPCPGLTNACGVTSCALFGTDLRGKQAMLRAQRLFNSQVSLSPALATQCPCIEPSTDIMSLPMSCPVLASHIGPSTDRAYLLRAAYAVSGADILYGAIRMRGSGCEHTR
eukprot:848686-Rhodomonas_salina.3